MNINFRKYGIILLSTVAVLYIAYCVFFFVIQRSILFPIEYAKVPKGISEQIPIRSKIKIRNDFGVTETWFLPPFNVDSNKTYPLMIVGHGNGDVIDRWVNLVVRLREVGVGILLVEYPGYGRSKGEPKQENITKLPF